MSLSKKSSKELVSMTRNLIQPLLPSFHKGQAGRIVVVGGCEDYTGAPFFSAHSAALMGCDLSHIICEKNASTVIKSYSPDLMVHPYLYESHNPEIADQLSQSVKPTIQEPNDVTFSKKSEHDAKLRQFIDDRIMPKVESILNRMHVVIVGPGFGRDELMLKTLTRIIEEVRVLKKHIILDADALYLVSLKPEVIKNYQYAILTPNVVEFERIATKLGLELKSGSLEDMISSTIEMSKKLGGLTIVRKGTRDIIVKKDDYIICDLPGSYKRVGGQGDTLTGTIATLLAWSINFQDELWEIKYPKLTEDETTLLACFGGSIVTRLAARKAFEKHGRSTQTSDVHKFVGESFHDAFEVGNPVFR